MATALTSFRPSPIISSSAASNHRKPIPPRRSNPSSSSSANWWTPLFGWPSEPDYIRSVEETPQAAEKEPGRVRSRFAPGCFTEEKARQLRRKTAETTAFHDIMYHSAIASRLASGASEDDQDV